MTIAAFYDQLSAFYHVIYPDWEASMAKQAQDLDSVIRQVWGQQVNHLLLLLKARARLTTASAQ